MVKAHPLFRRRLVVDHHTKVAAENLIQQHGNRSRPDHVGKIFQPVNHNYLYGVTRLQIVEQITSLVREGKSLESIWKDVHWFDPKNRENVRTLSVMGSSKEKWAVQFAEVLMIDVKAKYDSSNSNLMFSIPMQLAIFYWVFGMNWKLLGKLALAGVVVSEASHLYRENKGFSMIEFLLYGVVIQHLYQTRKLVSLPALVVAGFAFAPLYQDPPLPGDWKSMTGREHTAHDLHYMAMASGLLLRWFKLL